MQQRKRRRLTPTLPDSRQLSLFEPPQADVSTLFDFVKARLDYGPEMTPEEYQRWIKILIHQSLKTLS